MTGCQLRHTQSEVTLHLMIKKKNRAGHAASPVTVVDCVSEAGGVDDGEQEVHASLLHQDLGLLHLQRGRGGHISHLWRRLPRYQSAKHLAALGLSSAQTLTPALDLVAACVTPTHWAVVESVSTLTSDPAELLLGGRAEPADTDKRAPLPGQHG